MSVYPVKYKVLNKDTGRKVSVTRWRAQIRKNGENLSKLFEEEEAARSWEKSELDRLAMGVPPALITDLKYQLEMPDMQGLLKTYYTKHAVNHLSESSLKTTKNRCLSAIPKVPLLVKKTSPCCSKSLAIFRPSFVGSMRYMPPMSSGLLMMPQA